MMGWRRKSGWILKCIATVQKLYATDTNNLLLQVMQYTSLKQQRLSTTYGDKQSAASC
jgi:hypothetical protein